MINKLSTSSARPAALAQLARAIEASQGEIRHQANQLEAAVSRYLRTCAEYPTPGLDGLAAEIYELCRQQTELQLWVAEVRNRFSRADEGGVWTEIAKLVAYAGTSPRNAARVGFAVIGGVAALRSPGEAQLRALLKDLTLSWATYQLERSLALIDGGSYVGGPYGALVVLPLALPGLLGGGFTVATLTVVDAWPRVLWSAEDADDIVHLFDQGLWITAVGANDPDRLRPIFKHLEAIDRQLRAHIGAFTEPRPPGQAERPGLHPDGRLDVTATDMFEDKYRLERPDGTFLSSVGALLNGDHSLISGYLGEQVSMAEVTPGSYVIGINGLSPENMTVAPNGLVSVGATAFGGDPQANPYYRHVRERFTAYIEQLPPNSTLHLAGHSMGGGMIFLLLNDPAMQELLLARGVTLGSVTTLGAVRPDPPNDMIPPRQLRAEAARLFDGAEIRHYVDTDDALALNVGAGHAGYADVIMLDNGTIDAAVEAHITYDLASFAGLPPDLQVLPFATDPAAFRLFPRVPPPPPPVEEPPTIILAA